MNIKKIVGRLELVFVDYFKACSKSTFFYVCLVLSVYLSIRIFSHWPFVWFLVVLFSIPILFLLTILIVLPLLKPLDRFITNWWLNSHSNGEEDDSGYYKDRSYYGPWPFGH